MDSHRKLTSEEAEKIVSGHEGCLLRYAMLVLGDDSLAQDAVESVFINTLQGRAKRTGLSRDELSAELYRAIHAAAVGLARARAERRERNGADGTAMEAVRELEPEELQVVILRIIEHKNNDEVSRIIGISKERVASLLYKSVIKAAGKLKKVGLL